VRAGAQAIKILNMIKVYGKPIRVNKASQDKKQQDIGANLFIGNLDSDVDEKARGRRPRSPAAGGAWPRVPARVLCARPAAAAPGRRGGRARCGEARPRGRARELPQTRNLGPGRSLADSMLRLLPVVSFGGKARRRARSCCTTLSPRSA